MPDGSLLAIAGSPEVMRREEIESYKRDRKGAYLVDLSKGEPNLQQIDVEVRPQLEFQVDSETLESKVEELKVELSRYHRRPVVHITLIGKTRRRSDVMEVLSSLLQVAEYYNLDDRTVVSNGIRADVKSLGAREIISQYLKENGYTEQEISKIMQIIEVSDESVEDELRRFAFT